MRELKVVGLDVDGQHILCEEDDRTDTFRLRVDDRLRGVLRGDGASPNPPRNEVEARSALRPKEIQARIRAGASVEQLATAVGVDVGRIERFAHPVLLERSRAAELATAAHPMLPEGPSVLTLLETVTTMLIARGLDPDATQWDAWRNEDGRWTVQVAWRAGHSDNAAHFWFAPGAHGGTATAVDDTAMELIDPTFERPLRPVTPVAQLTFAIPEAEPQPPVADKTPDKQPPAPAEHLRAKRAHPAVPAWEDVLLGVRSSGER